MCDTFGIITKDYSIFAKNSDRSPNEVQVIQFIDGYKPKEKKLKVTYTEVEQVTEVYSILISRPVWLWGAEMGVNEFGVCIGNEAIFTKRKKRKKGLIGMDIVRLALERSKTAKEATEVIIKLIGKYHQGGNCGYDHNFFYDNSYLIMDRNELYILETSGEKYNLKKESKAAISNCLSIPKDNKNYRNLNEDKLYRFASGANTRRNQILTNLNDKTDLEDTFRMLRLHHKENVLEIGSVSSPCMHAGKIIGDHTTSSLVVKLTKDKINIYFTATSTPCLSVFKPFEFNDKVKRPICTNKLDKTYWLEKENILRNLIGYEIPKVFYDKRDILENEIIKNNLSLDKVLKKEDELNNILINLCTKKKINRFYKNYWKNKTRKLGELEKC